MSNPRLVQSVLGVLALIAVVFLSQWQGSTRGPEGAASPPVEARSGDGDATAPITPAAQSDAAFDYYVLVLSWSPTYCAGPAGRGHDDDLQCRAGRPYGFVLHGLWPQNKRGYPQDCASRAPRFVANEVMARALDVSPSPALVQHEWEKHGTCSGLSQSDYFDAAIGAYHLISVPPVYLASQQPMQTTPDEVRARFLAANPRLASDGLSVTCGGNDVAELWVCLDRQLVPRACSNEVQRRHCGDRKVRMRAVRGDWPG